MQAFATVLLLVACSALDVQKYGALHANPKSEFLSVKAKPDVKRRATNLYRHSNGHPTATYVHPAEFDYMKDGILEIVGEKCWDGGYNYPEAKRGTETRNDIVFCIMSECSSEWEPVVTQTFQSYWGVLMSVGGTMEHNLLFTRVFFDVVYGDARLTIFQSDKLSDSNARMFDALNPRPNGKHAQLQAAKGSSSETKPEKTKKERADEGPAVTQNVGFHRNEEDYIIAAITRCWNDDTVKSPDERVSPRVWCIMQGCNEHRPPNSLQYGVVLSLGAELFHNLRVSNGYLDVQWGDDHITVFDTDKAFRT